MPARHNWHILHIQTSRWDADLANEWWGCSLSGDYSALTTASQLSPLPKHISSRRQARGRLRGADLGLEGVLLWEGREGVRLQEHQSSGSVIFPHGLRPVRHFLALSAPMWLCAPRQIVTYMCTHTYTQMHTQTRESCDCHSVSHFVHANHDLLAYSDCLREMNP